MVSCCFADALEIADAGLNVRALLKFRLSGGVRLLVKLLTEQYERVIAESDRGGKPFSQSTIDSSIDVLKLLALLGLLCKDCDFSIDFATFGGHAVLKKLLLIDNDNSFDIIEGVDGIIGAITASGNIFPSRSIVSDNLTEIVRPTVCKFEGASKLNSWLNIGREFDDGITDYNVPTEFSVLLRAIPLSIYGTGQHAVGYLLWSSAVILSRLIVDNEEKLVRNKIVLECGAGLGLCGIVAARFACAVSLSDFSEILVRNLDYNISINRGPQLLDGHCGAISDNCAVDVSREKSCAEYLSTSGSAFIVDWNSLADQPIPSTIFVDGCQPLKSERLTVQTDEHTATLDASVSDSESGISRGAEKSIEIVNDTAIGEFRSDTAHVFFGKSSPRTYDVIIGSDLVYCKTDPMGILKVLSKYLSQTGIFIIVCPEPSHRYGTEYLVPTLQNGGFEVYYKSIAHTNCTSSEVLHSSNESQNFKRSWTSAKTAQNIDKDTTDNFIFDGEYFCNFFQDFLVSDDHLVSELDERDFVAWQLVIGHRAL